MENADAQGGAGNLQANGHIRRNAENIIIYNQIPRMDDMAAANPGFVLLPEFQQRIHRIACAGFDLNGVHFVFCPSLMEMRAPVSI